VLHGDRFDKPRRVIEKKNPGPRLTQTRVLGQAQCFWLCTYGANNDQLAVTFRGAQLLFPARERTPFIVETAEAEFAGNAAMPFKLTLGTFSVVVNSVAIFERVSVVFFAAACVTTV
jgi:hypothetical protein